MEQKTESNAKNHVFMLKEDSESIECRVKGRISPLIDLVAECAMRDFSIFQIVVASAFIAAEAHCDSKYKEQLDVFIDKYRKNNPR